MNLRIVVVLALKGMAMGAANVIPGVSGGTIAFVTGIYERLINALKSIDLVALRLLFRFKIKEFSSHIDLPFLLAIFAGVFISILSLAKALEYAFEYYEVLTLAFFFGLIVASIFGVGRQISKMSFSVAVTFIIGAAIALSIAFMTPATANDGFFYVFLCGIVAVCSMILPGLSGSYILLLMGNYVLVLRSISSFDFGVLIPLLLGCVAGLAIFSRLLSFLFSYYKDATISLLTGFVAGSLLIIWPWKNTEMEEVSAGKMKAVGYDWYLPSLDTQFFIAVGLAIMGFILVWAMERFSQQKPAE
jgi:putative membrane protein